MRGRSIRIDEDLVEQIKELQQEIQAKSNMDISFRETSRVLANHWKTLRKRRKPLIVWDLSI